MKQEIYYGIFELTPMKKKLKTFRRKLKKIFSEYIRRRDAHVPFMLDRRGKCCTCGKWLRWNSNDANAGHYVSVGSATQGTEYDERNVNLQCVYDNKWGEGKKPEYTLFLVNKYGPGIVEELVKQSKWTLVEFVWWNWMRHSSLDRPQITTQEAYEWLITYYTKKLEDLK